MLFVAIHEQTLLDLATIEIHPIETGGSLQPVRREPPTTRSGLLKVGAAVASLVSLCAVSTDTGLVGASQWRDLTVHRTLPEAAATCRDLIATSGHFDWFDFIVKYVCPVIPKTLEPIELIYHDTFLYTIPTYIQYLYFSFYGFPIDCTQQSSCSQQYPLHSASWFQYFHSCLHC